jgi:hypothetical protein
MSYDTTEHILWPYDREDDIYPICQCGAIIRNEDLCEIRGEYFCDICASELTLIENT